MQLFREKTDTQEIYNAHLRWAELHAHPLQAEWREHRNDPAPGRRLRIGYVSPHFWEHAVAFFLEPLLANHDHDNFEIFCYSDSKTSDEVTERSKHYADHWRDIWGWSDPEV